MILQTLHNIVHIYNNNAIMGKLEFFEKKKKKVERLVSLEIVYSC